MGRRRLIAQLAQTRFAITDDGLKRMMSALLGRRLKQKAISTVPGTLLRGTRSVTIRDGVATQRIVGPMVRQDDWYLEYLGWSSYEGLALDYAATLASPEVKALIQLYNTPGGEVNGCHELSQLFSQDTEKPVVAMVSGDGCSAGYWLASAADEIVASADAILGCLGVQFSVLDDTGMLEQLGLKWVEITSSQTPKKNPNPTTPEGQAAIQAVADRLADVMLDDIAEYRGEDRATIDADYGQGGLFVGAAAVDAGLADRVSTYEELHAELVAQITTGGPPAAKRSTAAHAAKPPVKEPHMPEATPAAMTPEAFAAQFPAAVATWRAEGAAAERERLTAIDRLAKPGLEKIIAEAKADPKASAGDTALKIVEADAAKAKGRLGALKASEEHSDMPPEAPAPDEQQGADHAVAQRVLGTHRRITGATTDRAPAQRS